MRLGFAMGLVAVFLSVTASVWAGPLERRGDFWERYAPTADISGSPVLGLVAIRAGETLPSGIAAAIPASWEEQMVCARMVSSDGRYGSYSAFWVPLGWRGEIAELEIPTEHLAELNALDEMELGVAVSLNDCAEQPEMLRIVPAAWGSTGLGAELRLLINSFRADEAYLYFASENLDVDCEPVSTDARTAFDMVCPIPSALTGAGTVEVELNRVRRGAIMGSVYFTVELP